MRGGGASGSASNVKPSPSEGWKVSAAWKYSPVSCAHVHVVVGEGEG